MGAERLQLVTSSADTEGASRPLKPSARRKTRVESTYRRTSLRYAAWAGSELLLRRLRRATLSAVYASQPAVPPQAISPWRAGWAAAVATAAGVSTVVFALEELPDKEVPARRWVLIGAIWLVTAAGAAATLRALLRHRAVPPLRWSLQLWALTLPWWVLARVDWLILLLGMLVLSGTALGLPAAWGATQPTRELSSDHQLRRCALAGVGVGVGLAAAYGLARVVPTSGVLGLLALAVFATGGLCSATVVLWPRWRSMPEYEAVWGADGLEKTIVPRGS